MRLLIACIATLLSLSSYASSKCLVNDFIKSPEGKEKLTNLFERSKSLALSKLEDLGIDESQVQIKAVFPQNLSDAKSSLMIDIKSKSHKAENSKIVLKKIIQDEGCALEISIQGGRLINSESGKNFGSLGKVKEVIRL